MTLYRKLLGIGLALAATVSLPAIGAAAEGAGAAGPANPSVAGAGPSGTGAGGEQPEKL